jgi:ketosteroid isomerase-like protein
MSSGNGDIARRLYRAFNERDTKTTRELMAPNVEWVNPEDAVEPGTRQGWEDYQRALAGLRESFEEISVEVERIEEAGDRVAAVIEVHVRGRGSGLEATTRQSGLWTFRDGRAVRYEWFNDPEAALRDLGA